MCWQPGSAMKHMAAETLPHTDAVSSSSTPAGQLVSQRALAAPLRACAGRRRKEDFLWDCDRPVTEPALLSDDQRAPCLISPSPLSDPLTLLLPLICRSHQVGLTLQCIGSTTSLTCPLHCWLRRQSCADPPTFPCLAILLTQPTHCLACFIANQVTASPGRRADWSHSPRPDC